MKRYAVALIALLGAGLSVWATPAYRAELTVSGYAGEGELADFPVLVRISPQTIRGFDYGQCLDGAADLSFVDENGNLLDFEVDTWNPNGESLVWVRLPTLANGTIFAVQWGDPAAPEHDAFATWNANYGGVWHLGEAEGVCANSTKYGATYAATPKGNTENSVRYTGDDAPVGGARQTATSAARGYLSVPSYSALGFGDTFTISGWIRFDSVTGYVRRFSRKRVYSEKDGWEIEMLSGSYTGFSARGNNQAGISGTFPGKGFNKTWVHVALVYSGATLTVYGDGELVQSGAITAAGDVDYDLSFGCDSNGDESYVSGEFDECRLMDGVASADWVKAEYDTVKNAAFLTYGEAEAAAVDPTLALGKPSVRNALVNAAEINVMVRGIGEGASSVTLKCLYGELPDQLTTEQAAGSVTAAERAAFTLRRLYPDRKYYAKVVAENDLGESVESDIFVIVTPKLVETSGFPGINQTFFTSANMNWDKDYATLPEGTDWTHYTDSDRIYRRELGTLAAYVGGNPKATQRRSAVWGDDVYWPVNGGQWVYWGTMYMDAEKTYKFRMKIDDNERVVVTDAGTGFKQVLLNDVANGSGVVTSSAFQPSVTGWHKIEIRMSDGSGGAGGYNTSDNYLNTENMGWSDDNGSSWKLMMDPGDGSLLRTDGAVAMTAEENISAGRLNSVTLSFAASDRARDLYVAYGPVYGGNELSAWQTTAKVGTIGAGATSYTYNVPASWGTDDNLVLRFYYLDRDLPFWSTSVFWRDLSAPALGDLTLNGRGGDTLVVSGDLVSFGGSSCTLKVHVGQSADALDTVWTGLEGSVRTAAGAYELTLFEGNAAAARYLKPGETYFVCVEATANGKSARTGTAKVTMSREAVYDTTASAVSRRTVTFTGSFADLGMADQSEVSLWVGNSGDESTFEQSGDPLVVTDLEKFTFTHTFPAFETTYYWQLRAANESAGKTANAEARTAVASCKTLDTTTYTWTGGESGDWSDSANWSDNQSGDTLGYPNTAAATASFPADRKVTVRFTEPLTVGYVNLNATGVDVTFEQGGEFTTNETMLTVATSFNFDGSKGRLTLDSVALKTPGVTVGTQSEVILTNAANWYADGDFWAHKFGSVRLYGDSWLSCNQLGLGGGDSVISDSTLWTRSNDILGHTNKGGSMRFAGTHPLWWHNASGNSFYSSLADAGYRFDFVVPVGGFTAPVIRGPSGLSYYMGNNQNNPGGSPIAINVLDESPANRVDATITTPLISWPKGINKAMIVEGTLPDDGQGTDDSFVWGEGDYPATLDVTIVGSTHGNALSVSGSPENAAGDRLSPAYGEHAVEQGGTLTCTAPSETVQISDDKRATCTGWKLYAVDAVTHARTLVGSGEGTSYTFTNDDGLWHELEWQWKVEYKITVTSAGNGTATVDEEWVETGKKARVTQTPAAGYGFGRWTGDVPAERDKSMELRFTVRDRAYSFEASFLPVVYVDSQNGSDANGGTSWSDALATIAAALQKNANGYILLADGTYEVTSQIALTGGATIAGANPGAKAVVKCMTKLSADTGAGSSIFKLAHADARLYNLTITTDYDKNVGTANAYGAARNGDFARGVWLEGAGLVDSCVITNCRSIYCPGDGGGGVFLNNGGVVRNTLLTHNTTYSSGGNNAHGHNAIVKTSGLIENCVLTWGATGVNESSSAHVSLKGANAILRNCLVTHGTQGHDNVHGATGVKLEPGVMENCTVARNFHGVSTQTKGVYVYGGGSIVRNCVIWDNTNNGGLANWGVNPGISYTATRTCTTPAMPGTGNISTDPAFVNANGDDFHLGLSGAVDAAEYLEWMDWVDDLDGKDRAQGVAPDMGCYEFTASALTCGFDVETTGALGTDTVTLKALVMGSDLDGLVYTWTLTDQDGTPTVRSGSDLATLVIPMPVGSYTVALSVKNGAGGEAAAIRPDAFSVSPSDIYVAVGGAGKFPYDSYENGATTLATALEAASDGTVIHVNDGWHYLADTLAVSKDVTFVSENGPDRTFVFGRAQTSGAPVILLNSSNAKFSGFTLAGKDQDGKQPEQWGALRMTGGVLTNCCVCNHKTVNNQANGSGCRLEGGTVVDCLFTNNFTQCSGGAGARGGAIYQTGANTLIDRCILASNKVTNGGISLGGGIYLNNGTARNLLVIGNYSINYGGGVAVEASGMVQNCTVVNNTSGTGNGGIWQNGGTVADCILYSNMANGALEDADDPGFVDAKNGDYHLVVASAAVDASVTAGIGDFDLDRKPRISGRKSAAIKRADKGCYEYDFSQFSIGISFAKLTKFAPGGVEFRVDSTDELDPAACWWTFDGSEPTAENHAAAGVCVTNSFGFGSVTVRFKTIYDSTTYAIDKPDWFVMYGETVYLVEANEGAKFPYATPETAATDLSEAFLAVQDGSTLLIDDGTYKVNSERILEKNVTIRSVNGPAKTILDCQGMTRPFTLAHPGAVLSGVTILQAQTWVGGALQLKNGSTVTNCVIDTCRCQNPNSGAVWMEGGSTLVDCRITNSYVFYDARENCGVAVYAVGKALIDRCVVTGSHEGKLGGKTDFTPGNGAIYLAESGGNCGTVRNTVVADNHLQGCGGIVVGKYGRVENCTVIGNVSTNVAETAAGIKILDASASVVNTIVYGNRWGESASEIGGVAGFADCFENCLIGIDPQLRGKGSKAYRPATGSPCIDAGKKLDWMTGAIDLYGQPRVQGQGADKKPDIGAGEYCPSGFRLLVK